jgi:hypothetical protein
MSVKFHIPHSQVAVSSPPIPSEHRDVHEEGYLQSEMVRIKVWDQIAYLVTVEITSVAFSQLSFLASHLGDSLQSMSPTNKATAGQA